MPKKFKNCSECGRAAKHSPTCSRFQPKYAEFDTLVQDVVALVAFEINRKAPRIESTMPYKQQLVLERVIKRLQECV